MKVNDYSEALKQSAEANEWKTARNVRIEDFPRITRRLRYQASTLGLSIEISTDKQEHTISFLTQRIGSTYHDKPT